MLFENKQIGKENKDLKNKDLDYYLTMTNSFVSSFKDFQVIEVDGFNIIDESLANPVGFKARAGEMLVANCKTNEIVYVQPRNGFAGISLAYLCEKYNKKLTLFMPSSKEISNHQALCIERGAEPRFVRIAAMPNLNKYAKEYADKKGATFVPLGLNHEEVTALAVKSVYEYFKDKDKPKRMWCVISTGVLSRALQIALPNTTFFNVGVSRNIQQGELGKANYQSYHKPFTSVSDHVPTGFDCEKTYDAKGFDYMFRSGIKGDWFFNVAGNAPNSVLDKSSIDSYRDWRDFRDLHL